MVLFIFYPQQITRLTVKHFADGFQRREADGSCLAGLQDGEICERDVRLLRELSQRHAPLVQQFIQLYSHGHQTVPSRSSRMRLPASKMRTMTNTISTVRSEVIETDGMATRPRSPHDNAMVMTALAGPPGLRVSSEHVTTRNM
jgi:hypothetical protein